MAKTTKPVIRIGGASGAIVDSAIAVPQLLSAGKLDYLIFDYLSEGSMGIFGKMMAANPQSGFASDFVDGQIGPCLAEIKSRGIKVIANAGGLNPRGLALALARRAEALGLDLRIATIEGDDLRQRLDELRSEGIRDMFSGAPFPERIISINAYLGGFPIAAALAKGADIVITGRVVDSALVLGPLIHEFGWQPGDHDLLAAGTVAGHLLECGAQVTGGTFTDWRDVPGWENIGFPIGECHADGSLVVTKPPNTGGLVSVGTVSEQLLYEVSDPQLYFVPDVTCDFAAINLEQVGPDRVHVSGARGYPPTASYKVCVTYEDGWRSVALQPIIGLDALAKAKRQAEAILERTRTQLRARKLADWRRTHVEILGSEVSFGARAQIRNSREVICRIVVEHDDKRATDLFWREQNAAIMNMSVGTTIPLAIAMPPSFPVTALFSFLIDKVRVPATLTIDGSTERVAIPTEGGFEAVIRPQAPQEPARIVAEATVPLIALAWARSGEKGNLFNVAVIARRVEFLRYIRAALTPAVLAGWYRHFLPSESRIEQYDVPGIHALNFVVHDSMAGGMNSSPHLDAAAKGMAQQLLEIPIPVTREIALQLSDTGATAAPWNAAQRAADSR
jgi:hypothetical protein